MEKDKNEVKSANTAQQTEGDSKKKKRREQRPYHVYTMQIGTIMRDKAARGDKDAKRFVNKVMKRRHNRRNSNKHN